MLSDHSGTKLVGQGLHLIGYDASHVLVKKNVDKGICFSSVVNGDNDSVPVKKLDSRSCRNLLIRRISARVLLAFEPISFWLARFGLLSSARFWLRCPGDSGMACVLSSKK